jgi:hypothetical protein
VLAALSTGHKIGMLVMAGLFIGWALVSSLLIPRSRPDFPGSRGRNAHILVSAVLAVGMLLAVEFFAVEEEEPEGGEEPAAAQVFRPV